MQSNKWVKIFDFPGGSDSKASVYNAGDLGLNPGLGRSPGEGNGNPLQDYCLEKYHGQRSLVGYSPRGHKESDTTERLHFSSLSSKERTTFAFVAAVTICNDVGAQEHKTCPFPLFRPLSAMKRWD